jgi:hypothetical protein
VSIVAQAGQCTPADHGHRYDQPHEERFMIQIKNGHAVVSKDYEG